MNKFLIYLLILLSGCVGENFECMHDQQGGCVDEQQYEDRF